MILELPLSERVEIDRGRMAEIALRLGRRRADQVIAGAMEDIAVTLAASRRAFARGRFAEAGAAAGRIARIAAHVGLPSLERVALQVAGLASRAEPTAMAASMRRLGRVGEDSLLAAWELDDMTL